MIYKIQTGTKVHWFKTLKGADRFAARNGLWRVETPTDELEIEWGKKKLKIPNKWDELSII